MPEFGKHSIRLSYNIPMMWLLFTFHRRSYRGFLRKNRDENDSFISLSDRHFKRAFRLTKAICRHFITLLRPFMVERVQKHGLTINTRVMCALRFFAHGCYQYPVGNDPFVSLSPASVSRAIHEVSKVIVDHLTDQYIKFPDEADRAVKKQQ